jgi:hypothetical protein
MISFEEIAMQGPSRIPLDSERMEIATARAVRFAEPPPKQVFNTASVNYSSDDGEFKTHTIATPKFGSRDLQYKKPEERAPALFASQKGSMVKPNYEDMLRRVGIVVQQHISKCEQRLNNAKAAKTEHLEQGLFYLSQANKFAEEKFLSPQYRYHFVRAPLCRLGFLYGIRVVDFVFSIPSAIEVNEFLSELFIKASLSAECSIVCLIYIERLMEQANVPLLSNTWRPVVMSALLLASKVWQDLSSWNIEFSEIYPQYSLTSINQLEKLFCQEIKWDLFIPTSAYAKYYFALRSLTEKKDFRRNAIAQATSAPGAKQVEERSGGMKEELLSTVLSRSL